MTTNGGTPPALRALLERLETCWISKVTMSGQAWPVVLRMQLPGVSSRRTQHALTSSSTEMERPAPLSYSRTVKDDYYMSLLTITES